MSMPPVISVFYAEEGKSLLSFNFLVSQYQKIIFKQFGVRGNFGYRKKKHFHRGVSRFSVEQFLSHSTEKLRKRSLVCFRKFLVWKKLWMRWGGGYHFFR